MNIQIRKAPGVPDNGKLPLSQIRFGGGTQSREKISKSVVMEYAEALNAGAAFPPVVVFYDGEIYWLADGFHRKEAHHKAGKKQIAVDVRQGTQRDAILFSVGANGTHGLRRTNDDKRHAVQMLLNDPEWRKWSDREIARRCAVDHKTVAGLRPQPSGEIPQIERTVQRGGSTYSMDTSAIGQSAADVPEPDEEAIDAHVVADDASARQEAHDAAREGAAAALPQEIKDREQAHAEWRARAKAGQAQGGDHGDLTAEERIAELQETVRALEADKAALEAESLKFRDMRVQFEAGGFDKVVAGKDEEIRVLKTRIYRESEDKAGWARSAKWWKEQALKLGWSSDEVIPFDPPAEEARA